MGTKTLVAAVLTVYCRSDSAQRPASLCHCSTEDIICFTVHAWISPSLTSCLLHGSVTICFTAQQKAACYTYINASQVYSATGPSGPQTSV